MTDTPPPGAHTHPELNTLLSMSQEILDIVRTMPDRLTAIELRLTRVETRLDDVEQHLRRITPNGQP